MYPTFSFSVYHRYVQAYLTDMFSNCISEFSNSFKCAFFMQENLTYFNHLFIIIIAYYTESLHHINHILLIAIEIS